MNERRAPWWQWFLLSLSSTFLVVGWTLAAVWLLWRQGLAPWDLMDYVLLSRPPWIRDGGVAAGLALLLAGQTAPALLAMAAFRPARWLAFGGLRPPARLAGMLKRVGLGAVMIAGVQAAWSAVAPPLAEHWRVVDHLVYAVVRGRGFWPLFWILLAAGVVIPATEEILFRGFLYGLIRQRKGPRVAAFLTAALFGLAHGPLALPTAVLGFYLAWQAEQDGSLAGAILLHALNNLGALLILISQLTE